MADGGVSGVSDLVEVIDDCRKRGCVVFGLSKLSWSKVGVRSPGREGDPSPTLGVRAGGVENSDVDEFLV